MPCRRSWVRVPSSASLDQAVVDVWHPRRAGAASRRYPARTSYGVDAMRSSSRITAERETSHLSRAFGSIREGSRRAPREAKAVRPGTTLVSAQSPPKVRSLRIVQVCPSRTAPCAPICPAQRNDECCGTVGAMLVDAQAELVIATDIAKRLGLSPSACTFSPRTPAARRLQCGLDLDGIRRPITVGN